MSRSPVTRSSDPVLACDLFAGAGGFSLGAHFAQVTVAAALENNLHACSTYRSNLIDTGLMNTTLFTDDIRKLSPKTFLSKTMFKDRSCDILLGGPPCQGFSSHRLNNSGVDDPRNALLLRYFEYVRTLRPLIFLVENVPGLLWPRHSSFLQKFYRLAKSAKYLVSEPIVLNAKDFGVPQNRKRVFLLGYDTTRLSSIQQWPPQKTFGPPGNNEGLPIWKTASEAFNKPALIGDPNNIHMKHSDDLVEVFKKTPPNGGSRHSSGRVLPCHQHHIGHNDVYGRIDPAHPSPTMTTACINPSKGRFVHPTQHHGITLRQAARLQSFPDWFNFEGGIMAGGVQVGNAVPVHLATAVIEPLRETILEYRKTIQHIRSGEAA